MTQRGFTLIELLVVITVVAILSSVIFAAVNDSRLKGRDAKRFSDMNEIRSALELYYTDYGQYPPFNAANTSATACTGGIVGAGNTAWCNLRQALRPYLDPLPDDAAGANNVYRYYYDADSGDNYQTYGLMMVVEYPGNMSRVANDNGYASYANTSNGQNLEFGQQPAYCNQKYTSTSRNWWGAATTVCVGGN